MHKNLKKKIKIASWECPKKGCGYSFIPGINLTQAPAKGFGNRSWRRGKIRGTLKIVPACPKDYVNLVKHVEEIGVA